VKYRIEAEYKVKKELIIEVPDGLDPLNPANWGEFESEHDMDCWLYDVDNAEPYEEEEFGEPTEEAYEAQVPDDLVD
jgi:hypothetical protein